MFGQLLHTAAHSLSSVPYPFGQVMLVHFLVPSAYAAPICADNIIIPPTRMCFFHDFPFLVFEA